ncbi:MAG: hypothetical protein ACJA0N_001205 [Pseudohongiellaceae bacterium]
MLITEQYRKLLIDKGPTVLSVFSKDGAVKSSLVWSDIEGGLISINMMAAAPKLKRIVRSKKATVLKVDPQNEDNYISIRCSLVGVESDGAIEHLDKMTKRHYGKDKWYGDMVPDVDVDKKTEVIVYLKPERIYYT